MQLFRADCYNDDHECDTYIMIGVNKGKVESKIIAKNYCYSEIKIKELDFIDGYKVKLERIEE